jgi:alkylated DNA repair dioxygenase AlkB
MNTLFDTESSFPPGFFYFPDFLTVEESAYLYEEISKIELHTFTFQGYKAKRNVASFGYDYNFENKSLVKGREIPKNFNALIEKVAKHLSVPKEDFVELLITQYPVGSVINWHRDAFPFDIIAGISLQSDSIFRLRPQDKTKQHRTSIVSLPLKQRSLYVMQGEARTSWQHSILPVRSTRYSITLRTLKREHNPKRA